MSDTGVLGSLTMADLSALRKMKPADAELYLSSHTLTDDEKTNARSLIGRDMKEAAAMPEVRIYDSSRALWMITAWLVGASWRQLARYHHVAPQTVMSIADRRLTSVERQSQRLQREMSLEALDTYHASFTANLHTLKDMTPLDAAKWLVDHTELDNE